METHTQTHTQYKSNQHTKYGYKVMMKTVATASRGRSSMPGQSITMKPQRQTLPAW